MKEDEKHCPFCGEIIKVKARKCKHCGKWFDKTIMSNNNSNSETTNGNDIEYIEYKEHSGTWLFIGIVVVVIALSFLIMKSDQNNTVNKNEVNEIEDTTQSENDDKIIIPSKNLIRDYNIIYKDCINQEFSVMGMYYNCIYNGISLNSSEEDSKIFDLIYDTCSKKSSCQIDQWECINNILLDTKNDVTENKTNIEEYNQTQSTSYSGILEQIEHYQAKYFETIKGDNVSNIKTIKKHDKAINSMFNEFEKRLNKSSKALNYLDRLKNIDNKYKNKNLKYTIASAKAYNKLVDNLLNEVYQDIRKNIPKEDFEQLKQSEIKYIVNTENFIKDYKKTANYDENIAEYYWCNMRRFRTLLLLSYF